MPPPSPFRWNAPLRRYIDARGRIVSRAAVRAALDEASAVATARMRRASQEFLSGDLTRAQWVRAMRRDIKNVHLYNAAAAKGGWAQMTAADYGRVGSVVKGQYRFLNEWERAIEAGTAPRDGRFLSRAELYGHAGRHTFHDVERRGLEDAGITEERNVLNPADHCGECPALSAMGWVPLGTLPLPGERECGNRCKCDIEYR